MSRAENPLEMMATPKSASRSSALYLDLIERCLTNTIYGDGYTGVGLPGVERPFDPSLRETGRDWPRQAHTMIGRARLTNLRELVETAIREGVPGDLIETGVWRGGACILMRAALEAFGDRERRVFVADSFEGLPPPDVETYPADLGDKHHTIEELAVSLDEVKANFAKYGLLDDRVVFLKGWFKDTLRAAPIERLAVLRLDGDMYESTTDALTALYDKVSAGGFVIIDDYGCFDACRRAVHDFRDARGIADTIVDIDGWGVYWRKSVEPAAARLAPVRTPGARPFWSVIVPLYERGTYLKQCLDSVLEQDPGPGEMEILVVDDASPSDLSGLVGETGRGRVRYLRNASNLGLYPSTNAAIEATNGRFIHILHDDDWVANGFYRKMREAIETYPDGWRRLLPVRSVLRAFTPDLVTIALSRLGRVDGPEFPDQARDRMSAESARGRLRTRDLRAGRPVPHRSSDDGGLGMVRAERDATQLAPPPGAARNLASRTCPSTDGSAP